MQIKTTYIEQDSLLSRTVEWLRYPLMLLIVLIHTDTTLLTSMPQDGLSAIFYYITRTIVRVAVPMFFIISGYFFFRKPDIFSMEAYWAKIKKRVLTLLVPYIFWNYFVWAFQMGVVVWQGHADWIARDTFTLPNIVDVVVGWGEGYQGMPKAFQLWFLRDLMIVCLLSPLLHLLLKNRRSYVLLLLFTVFYLMPWPDNWHLIFMRFPSALLFFSVGAYWGIHNKNIINIVRKIPIWLSALLTILLLVVHVWQCMTGGHYIILFEKLFSIVAVVPTWQIASKIVERQRLKPVEWIANSNFLLFVLHPTIIYYLLVYPFGGNVSNTPLHFWIVYVAELIVPVFVCVILYAIMVRIFPRTTALLTGGRSGKNKNAIFASFL